MVPKAFSSQERKLVRDKLIASAQHYLSTTGIKKTSVEDLCRAAGISKGAFYLFYDCKELVFLDALEQEQQIIHDAIIRDVAAHTSKRKGFVAAILHMYQSLSAKPWLLSVMQDYDILVRRIPPERIATHIALDDASSRRLVQALGVTADHELVSAVLRTLFLSILHRKEIGDRTDDAVRFQLEAISAALFTEEDQ